MSEHIWIPPKNCILMNFAQQSIFTFSSMGKNVQPQGSIETFHQSERSVSLTLDKQRGSSALLKNMLPLVTNFPPITARQSDMDARAAPRFWGKRCSSARGKERERKRDSVNHFTRFLSGHLTFSRLVSQSNDNAGHVCARQVRSEVLQSPGRSRAVHSETSQEGLFVFRGKKERKKTSWQKTETFLQQTSLSVAFMNAMSSSNLVHVPTYCLFKFLNWEVPRI